MAQSETYQTLDETVACAANDGEFPGKTRFFYLVVERMLNVIYATRFIS